MANRKRISLYLIILISITISITLYESYLNKTATMTFQMRNKNDSSYDKLRLQIEEINNYGLVDYGYLKINICYFIPTIWEHSMNWIIGLETFLIYCDCLYFFVDKGSFIQNINYSNYNININTNKSTLFLIDNITLNDIKNINYNLIDFEYDIKVININHTLHIKHNIKNLNLQRKLTHFWVIPINDIFYKYLYSFNESVTFNDTYNPHIESQKNIISEIYYPFPFGKLTLNDKILSSLIFMNDYQNILHKCDYITKIDDDVIINAITLRMYLSFYNPQIEHYFGSLANLRLRFWKQNLLNHGGAWYTLSIAALYKLVNNILRFMQYNSNYLSFQFMKNLTLKCIRFPTNFHGNEDSLIGTCLRDVGIVSEETNMCIDKYALRLIITNYRFVAYLKQYDIGNKTGLVYKYYNINHTDSYYNNIILKPLLFNIRLILPIKTIIAFHAIKTEYFGYSLSKVIINYIFNLSLSEIRNRNIFNIKIRNKILKLCDRYNRSNYPYSLYELPMSDKLKFKKMNTSVLSDFEQRKIKYFMDTMHCKYCNTT
eukprot:463609_1